MKSAIKDDAFDQLRAELSAVEPSAAFAAGVRARVERPRGAGFRLQLALATATVAIAAVAGGAYWLREDVAAPAPAQPLAQSVAPAVASEPASVVAPKVRQPRRGPVVTRTAAAPVATTTSPGPFLEVITNQPEMLRRVWASIDGGIARVGLPVNEFADITVVPVTVDVIVVPKIGPPGGGGTTPGARRVVVDDSARGDQQ